MAVSIFSIFIIALSSTVVLALGGGRSLERRVRRPRLVQGVAAGAAAVLVPANA